MLSENQTLKNNDDLILEIEAALRLLDQLVEKRGIKGKIYSEKSFKKFLDLDVDTQKTITDGLCRYVAGLQKWDNLIQDNEELNRNEEIDCLKFALEEFDLKLSDDDTSFIDEGDIVEVYDEKGIQLYRNFQLLRINPYDLLTVISHDWKSLYDRAEWVTDSIANRIGEVMQSDSGKAAPFQIDAHTMKAVSHRDQVLVTINLKYIKPVYSKKTGKKCGFIATQFNSPILLEGESVNQVTMFRKLN